MSMTKWILACVVCLACDSAPPVGNDSGPVLPCPSQPSAGDKCDAGGLTCEYGSDPNVACNTVFECTGIIGATAWSSVVPDAGASCPTTIPALDPSCPKNVPSGLCADDAAVPLCHYSTGYCTCVGPSTDRHWACDSQDPKCPHPRPSLGTPCGEEDLRCYYLDCNVPWGAALICTGSTWHLDPTAPCGQ